MNPVTPDPKILPFKEYVAMIAYDIFYASINMTLITSVFVVYTLLYIIIVFIVITNS